MEISNLCCKNSIWMGYGTKFSQVRTDCMGNEFTEGAIVESVKGNNLGRKGMVVYLSGMGDCCIDDLRKYPSEINGYNWRDEGENLELISKTPLTKSQYEKVKEKDLYDVRIDKKFLDLELKHLYVFGNPNMEEEIQGNLFYTLGNAKNFVSWFSNKEWIFVKSNRGGYNQSYERVVKPLNPLTNKTSERFHHSKYIDKFVKESLVDAIVKKEYQIGGLPF